MTIGVPRKEEASLFRDINASQVKMNTSHLDHLDFRLRPTEDVKKEDTALWLAEELSEDDESPFYDQVYKGGKKAKATIYLQSVRTLKGAIQTTLSESEYLKDVETSYQKKYKLIRNYWQTVKTTFDTDWSDAKHTLLLSGVGFFALSQLASSIIDRSIRTGDPSVAGMKTILLPLKKKIDWRPNGTFSGFGGKGGASKAYEILKSHLPKEVQLKEVLKKI